MKIKAFLLLLAMLISFIAGNWIGEIPPVEEAKKFDCSVSEGVITCGKPVYGF